MKNQYSDFKLECGTDEAGRGCLAGPVTAAAVILPPQFTNNSINDSKQLTKLKRRNLRPIIENEAVSFAVTHVFEKDIDALNILNASIKAMQDAIAMLTVEPHYIIVDGNRFKPYKHIPYKTIIKGDGLYLNIAAASVLAKTYRDAYMEQLHIEYPMYNWKQNKGYPTKEHRDAIKKYGPSKYHRLSFRLLPEQYKMDL